MPEIKNRLFSEEAIRSILLELQFLKIIDATASDKLQSEAGEILEKTQNTSESFIDAYKKISIAAYKIFYEKLDHLRTLNVFDETIESTQKKIGACGQVIQEVLGKMTAYACKSGAILSMQAEVKAQLKALEPEIIQTANSAAANSTAAFLVRPGWLALISLGCISNPVTATTLATVFFTAEILKTINEFLDLRANKPFTYLGISGDLWSKYSTLSAKSETLKINEALITGRQRN